MAFSDIDGIDFEVSDDKIRFQIKDISTDWMSRDDSFITRIDQDNLNKEFLSQHLAKEIEMKNILDKAVLLYESGKYLKAIGELDRILFYDPEYAEALLYKSYALRGQKHFVKALRYYKRAINADASLKDIEYHKALLGEANSERDNFPKLKLNIYAGDEYFARGDFSRAVESYNRALVNPSKFKEKILSKLLNKKATALLKLKDYEGALECFISSQDVGMNDYAVFGEGYCEYLLGRDVCEGFKTRLDITKRQMLIQITALNDLRHFRKALEISDYLFENHFKEDDFYRKLVRERKAALRNLG